MAKLTKLMNPLADIISPEIEVLVEKWVLREAYQLNCDIIHKQIQKEPDKIIRTAMQRKIELYEDGIHGFTKELEAANFLPMEKDMRIMRLMARANIGERDFGRDSKIIKWPGASENILPGYRNLAHQMSELKIYTIRYYNKKDNEYDRKMENAGRALSEFMKFNFKVYNNSDQLIDKSNIFMDRSFYFKPEFVKTLLIYVPVAVRTTFSSLEPIRYEFDNRQFWKNMCGIMFDLFSPPKKTPDKPNGVRFKCSGYRIRIKHPKSVAGEAASFPAPQSPVRSIQIDAVDLGIEAIVITENRRCINREHLIKDVIISVRVVEPSGGIKRYTMQAGYCAECMEYLVLDSDFERVKKHGVILCPVIDRRVHYGKRQVPNPSYSEMESRIHQLGYNVQQEIGYTDKQREIILANIIENTDITIHEIKSNINSNMRRHQSQQNYRVAVNKWRKDLEFLSAYHMGDIQDVKVEKFVIGQRKK